MTTVETSQSDTELSHRLLVLASLMMAVAALLWGAIFAWFGEYAAAAIPWAFAAISFVMLAFCRHEKGYPLLRTSQLLLSLLMPFLLMWELGGFINSSAVVIWSLTSPMGALIFSGRKQAGYWFIAFLLLIGLGALIDLQPYHDNFRLPDNLITLLFVMNLTGVSLVAFILLTYFLGQKDRTLTLLSAERRRSDGLLRNMLPEAIGERLKHKQHPIADRLDNVTILFADISGFTSYAMHRKPETVVSFLDKVFSRFDEMSTARGLEKIKTIGDAYMLCGGLANDATAGAREAAAFALDAMAYVNTLATEEQNGLGLRVGLNTGPVVAGVIGQSKYSYDIWGDAVNVAARLQQAAQTGDILLSDNTAGFLDDHFSLELQGEMELRGHTPVKTYRLLGEITDA
tara:strand:+ start:85835 stop:87037 length:1203 start_codon:yes stop_codon:yes gene_type:complete